MCVCVCCVHAGLATSPALVDLVLASPAAKKQIQAEVTGRVVPVEKQVGTGGYISAQR